LAEQHLVLAYLPLKTSWLAWPKGGWWLLASRRRAGPGRNSSRDHRHPLEVRRRSQGRPRWRRRPSGVAACAATRTSASAGCLRRRLPDPPPQGLGGPCAADPPPTARTPPGVTWHAHQPPAAFPSPGAAAAPPRPASATTKDAAHTTRRPPTPPSPHLMKSRGWRSHQPGFESVPARGSNPSVR
jgi:hypothetical protein